MRRFLLGAFFLAGTAVALAQIAPGSQQNVPSQPNVPQQQPGAPQQQPGTDPTAPNAVPGAPPGFVPGIAGGNEAALASQPHVVRISGGVMAGNLVTKVDPVYPNEARAAHMGGTVVMTARISKSGHVEELAVMSGPRPLQAPAVSAVKQWVYRPYLLNGQPVAVDTTITVNFDPR